MADTKKPDGLVYKGDPLRRPRPPELTSRVRGGTTAETDSLYAAMDVGGIWLERALAGKL